MNKFDDPAIWPDELAAWLKQSAEKLQLLRLAVQHDLEQGTLPNALPGAGDAATILVLTPPLTKAMAGLSKAITASRPKRTKSSAKRK